MKSSQETYYRSDTVSMIVLCSQFGVSAMWAAQSVDGWLSVVGYCLAALFAGLVFVLFAFGDEAVTLRDHQRV